MCDGGQLMQLWLGGQQEFGTDGRCWPSPAVSSYRPLIPRREGLGYESSVCCCYLRSRLPPLRERRRRFNTEMWHFRWNTHSLACVFLSCSKCGALPPESCFFSLICSTGSFMGKPRNARCTFVNPPPHTHTCSSSVIMHGWRGISVTWSAVLLPARRPLH